MIISDKKKFIFIHIPKTGGSTVTLGLAKYSNEYIEKKAKRKFFDIDFLTHCWNNQRKTGWQAKAHYLRKQHSTFKSDFNQLAMKGREHYLKIAFVRNPWDLATSLFRATWVRRRNVKTTKANFKKFLKKYPRGYCRTQRSYIENVDGDIDFDFIGRYECFENDLNKLMKKLNIKEPIYKVNVSNKKQKPYVDYYDEESKQMIVDKFQKDIEAFNYDFA